MVTLIQVSDIKKILGRDPADASEEGTWESYIQIVSTYIDNYVDVGLEKIVDDVKRLRASWRGTIRLPEGPIHTLTSVLNFRTQQQDFYADFDGIDTIFFLMPNQVVDVKYTHGYDIVPPDIKLLALSTVIDAINDETAELRSYRVGDVEEQYRQSFFQKVIGEIGIQTLDKYSNADYTIDAGGDGRYGDYMSSGYLP